MRYDSWLVVLTLTLSACAVNPADRNDAGNGYYSQGAYAEALKAYQAAQVTSPDSAEPYYNAASALAQMGKLEDAMTALNQALKTADVDLTAKAYYNLGNIYFEMSRYDEAVQAYQETLLRQPEDNDARYNLELALRRIVPPSATPSEAASDEPSGQGVQTPTREPQNASPTPQPGSSDQATEAPLPSSESTMTLAEAQNLLDSIQQNQRTLGDKSRVPSTDESTSEKDW